mgnify:CR=1 FL=1
MKNTILKDIISNFDLMENEHFIEWFKESKSFMLEREKDQITESYREGIYNNTLGNNNFDNEQDYYYKTFNK